MAKEDRMKRASLIFLIFSLLSLSACGSYEEVNYRMTVEVDTPQGLRTGSSVIQVQGRTRPTWLPGSPGGAVGGFKGEAVTIEMPNGELMFALLQGKTASASEFLGIAFEERLKKEYARRIEAKDQPGFVETLEKMKSWTGVSETLPPIDAYLKYVRGEKVIATTSNYPTFVTFDNINDPKSIKEVDPNDLASSFGADIKLKRITITITNDAVTTGIEKKLVWLSVHPEPSLDPSHGPIDFSLKATLKHGSFSSGVRK